MKLLNTILFVFSTSFIGCNNPVTKNTVTENPTINISQTKTKAKQALKFCKTQHFNTEFCILIDMSLHSGLKRFLVWDFKKDTIVNSFLVGHGCGDNP